MNLDELQALIDRLRIGFGTGAGHQAYNRADIESLRPYAEIVDRILEGKEKGVGNG